MEPGNGKRYYALKVKNKETGNVAEAVSGYDGDDLEIDIAEDGATSKVRAEKEKGRVSAEGWDDLFFEEIPNSIANTIDRASAYKTDDDGSDCNADSGYDEHQIIGFSIEHHEDIDGLQKSLIAAVVGAGTGALFTSSTGPGAVVGGIVGALAGFIYNSLKDSDIYTISYVDWDVGGWGYYTKAVMPHAHGTWHSDDVEDMYKAGIPAPIGHIDDIATII
ncbi:complement resistance protein TraT [Halomicrobium salinisoli]|uniref:complement resistance protein TraT n=1 Tax=Halomicrobium salinisoli TaxID=2878391 RepID=UPI001CF0C832|nr:complement resistance protein TraT [Halomicrobium salinisoli]